MQTENVQVVTCPPCGENVGLPTKRGLLNKEAFMDNPSPRCWRTRPFPQGARGTARGFTLIELLVVVLIIGVLASVALPQYQRAVEKSRITEAVANLRAIANASELYYLENGSYPTNKDMDALSVEIPHSYKKKINNISRLMTNDWAYSIGGSEISAIGMANRIASQTETTVTSAYHIYLSPSAPNKLRCGMNNASKATSVQKKLCNELNVAGTL